MAVKNKKINNSKTLVLSKKKDFAISNISKAKKHNAKLSNKASFISEYQANKTPYAVELLNVTKTFNQGTFIANDNITFRVEKNEIHAIVGENGAGKTTLMSILFGSLPKDSGIIKVNGKIANFRSSIDATKHGIGMVHQHFKLVNVYSILDNIILGSEITKCGFLDRKKARKIIEDLVKKYKLNVDLDTKVNAASVGQQQCAEILKLLYRQADILIFDEPTAVLSDEEIDNFLKMLKEFKASGKTIILITHKLNEVKAVADRATIIHRGKVVDTVNVKYTSTDRIANLMVGHCLKTIPNKSNDIKYASRHVVCSIKNLNAYKISQPKVLALKDFNLDIHEGEIVGLAGIEGNGQTELSLILGGLLKSKVTGEVKYFDAVSNQTIDVLKANVKSLYDFGLAHIPEDRLKYGLILDDTVAMNIVLPQINRAPFTRFGLLNNRAINDYAENIVEQWDVRGANKGKALARSLSGGNQQKLVIGREISRPHKMSLFVQPVRGLDIGAIQHIHDKIVEDAKNGAAVLLISYELDEILAISSRVVVIDDGKIVYNDLVKKTNRAIIGKYLSSSAQAKQLRHDHILTQEVKKDSSIREGAR